jgi:hypothetical protein
MSFVECPHCKCQVEILEINCAIFRHGVLKSNGQQMNPHTPKFECDRLSETGEIYGCGKPFKVIKNNDGIQAEICDYI